MILLQMLCLDPQQICIFYSTSCTQVRIFEDQNEDRICPCDSVTTKKSICSKCSISGYFQQCIYLFAQNNASVVFLDIFKNASICLLKTIEAMQFLKATEEKGRNQTGSLHYLLPKIAQQKV
jgi:hypothetical protein